MKLSVIDILIYLLLFVFAISLPVELLKLEIQYSLLIKILIRLLLLTFYIYIILKRKIKILGFSTFKELAIFIPVFLICFTNIFASLIDGGFDISKQSFIVIFLSLILCIISAIIEEIVFRLFIHNSLNNMGSIKRIFLSALIFGSMHLINLVNVRSGGAALDVLLQTLYTFGLGLVLGFIYEYSHSLIFVAILHIMFNLFNDVIYGALGGYTSNLVFILSGVVMAILVGVYLIVLYFKKYKNTSSY